VIERIFNEYHLGASLGLDSHRFGLFQLEDPVNDNWKLTEVDWRPHNTLYMKIKPHPMASRLARVTLENCELK
jgi:hypothetical protein